jgi:hypothetical protein
VESGDLPRISKADASFERHISVKVPHQLIPLLRGLRLDPVSFGSPEFGIPHRQRFVPRTVFVQPPAQIAGPVHPIFCTPADKLFGSLPT